jgi:hypothetical protein
MLLPHDAPRRGRLDERIARRFGRGGGPRVCAAPAGHEHGASAKSHRRLAFRRGAGVSRTIDSEARRSSRAGVSIKAREIRAFMVVPVRGSCLPATGTSRAVPAALHVLAGQVACLFDPGDEPVLVEVVVLVDVKVTHLVVLGRLGGDGIKRAPAEEARGAQPGGRSPASVDRVEPDLPAAGRERLEAVIYPPCGRWTRPLPA